MKDQNPVGAILAWPRAQPVPPDYLSLDSDGQWLGRHIYPDLYAAIGDNYNDGPDAATFVECDCFMAPYMPTHSEDEKQFIIRARYGEPLVLGQPIKDAADMIRATMAQIAETLIQMHAAGPFCLIVQSDAAGGDLQIHFQEQMIQFRNAGKPNGG